MENTDSISIDFDRWYGRAFKITDNSGDPNLLGFSIVTPYNGDAWNWRERSEFKEIVKQRINDYGWLSDYKYQQIMRTVNGEH